MLTSILLTTCLGFVPLYACIRLSFERSKENVDLYFSTLLTPGAVVRGKYFAAMALTMLIYSACMPFMTLTYLLRGIDLPTIFLILASGFLLCAAANAVGVLAGSVQGSWFQRVQLFVWMLVVVPYLAVGMYVWSSKILRSGMGWALSDWAEIGFYLLLAIMAIGMLHILAIAALSHKASNRMMLVRLYLMACWAILGAIAVWILHQFSSAEILAGWTYGSATVFSIMLEAVLAERDDWSPRVQKHIPRRTWLRIPAFLVFTGSAGGLLWCTLLFGATIAITWGCLGSTQELPISLPMAFNDSFTPLLTIFGYLLCYSLTAVVIRTYFLKHMALDRLPGIVFILSLVMSLGPCLIAFFISGVHEEWQHRVPMLLLGSPFVLATGNEAAITAAQCFLIVWLLIVLLACLPWAVGQWRRFRPYVIHNSVPSKSCHLLSPR
jgi:hypothetical protein